MKTIHQYRGVHPLLYSYWWQATLRIDFKVSRTHYVIVTGTKSTPEVMSLYFNNLLTSDVAAVEPALLLFAIKGLDANVSGHEASQARHRSRRHGNCVTPSFDDVRTQTLRLSRGQNSRADECTTKQVIYLIMCRMTTGTTTTWETMVTISSDHCSADAGVRTNNRCSEAESRRNSNCGVVEFNIALFRCSDHPIHVVLLRLAEME